MSIIPVEVPTGAIRYNTDSNKMECYNGTKWMQIAVSSPDLDGGSRGLFMGGENPTRLNTIDYVTIATAGNATDFGNLTVARTVATARASNKTRGIIIGGYVSPGADTTVMDYVTIASTGNAADFGDLRIATRGMGGYSNSHGGLS